MSYAGGNGARSMMRDWPLKNTLCNCGSNKRRRKLYVYGHAGAHGVTVTRVTYCPRCDVIPQMPKVHRAG